MKIDRNRLLWDILSAKNYFASTMSKTDIAYNYDSIVVLNDLYEILTGYKVNLNKPYISSKSIDKYLDDKGNESYNKMFKYIDDNGTIICDIFDNISNMYSDMNFFDFSQYNYFDLREFSEKDFKDIILSYYSSMGDKYYKIAKKYFDEERIELGADIKCNPFFVHIYGSGYIVSSSPYFDTESLTNIVHELGHAIDMETFSFPQQKKKHLIQDLLLEVPSTFFEMNFLNWLITNRIDAPGCEILLNDRFSYMSEASDTINSVFNLDNFEYDGLGIITDINSEEKKEYPFRNLIIYGLGSYFALHLNNIKENNPEEFDKLFFNLISSRCECKKLEDSIEKLNIPVEDFVSGELIKSQIEENEKVLKKRYHIYE